MMTQHEISAFESKQESLSVAYCETSKRHANSFVTGSMDIDLLVRFEPSQTENEATSYSNRNSFFFQQSVGRDEMQKSKTKTHHQKHWSSAIRVQILSTIRPE
jgi:hypothetical protein